MITSEPWSSWKGKQRDQQRQLLRSAAEGVFLKKDLTEPTLLEISG
jgi:hypothetical protein